MKEKLFRTTVDLDMKINPRNNGSFKKAVADYLDTQEVLPIIKSENHLSLHKGQWQPDLAYISSILVSEGRNDNGDGFLRPKLIEAYETPENKFVDFEHDPDGKNDRGQNPKKYQIVGHIYESVISLQRDGKIVPESEVYRDGDNKWFSLGSLWRDTPIDLVVAWVIYKFQFPELAEMTEAATLDSPTKFGVSMEVLFSDYKYRVGPFDPAEEFEYDATMDGCVEARKDTPFAEELGKLWRSRQKYNGQDITRILGGTMFFSGMAITKNRANRRSVNLSIASQIEEEVANLKAETEETDLTKLVRVVASRNQMDLAKCELVDGEPSCGCIENAIASELDSITKGMNDLAETIRERKKLGTQADDLEPGDLVRQGDESITSEDGSKVLKSQIDKNDAPPTGKSSAEILDFIEEFESLIAETKEAVQAKLSKLS